MRRDEVCVTFMSRSEMLIQPVSYCFSKMSLLSQVTLKAKHTVKTQPQHTIIFTNYG